jgi:hypothetical protein
MKLKAGTESGVVWSSWGLFFAHKADWPYQFYADFTDRCKTCVNATRPILSKDRRCGGGLSSAAMLGSAPAREDTRLYTSRAVDIDDLALIRSIFRAAH